MHVGYLLVFNLTCLACFVISSPETDASFASAQSEAEKEKEKEKENASQGNLTMSEERPTPIDAWE